jgi:L-fuconolactonase
MRIDAHHHVWDLAVRDQPWTATIPTLRQTFTVAGLAPHLDANRIDATVLVQTVPVAEETPELLGLAAVEPTVAAVVGWVDLVAPDVSDRLERLRQNRGGIALAGIRHGVHNELEPRWLHRLDVRAGISAVGRAGLVYELLVRRDQLADAVGTVRDMPEVAFVLDHAGYPDIRNGDLGAWPAQVAALATHPNVTVKLSGLVTRAGQWTTATLAPYVDILLEQLGPARLMFGSDWPVCLVAASYSQVVEAMEALTSTLSCSERADVFGMTAARVYGIPLRPVRASVPPRSE